MSGAHNSPEQSAVSSAPRRYGARTTSTAPASGWRKSNSSATRAVVQRRGSTHRAMPMNGRYDRALTAKHATAPMLAISTPASAGPAILETLNWVELSARPAAIWRGATLAGMIDENEG